MFDTFDNQRRIMPPVLADAPVEAVAVRVVPSEREPQFVEATIARVS